MVSPLFEVHVGGRPVVVCDAGPEGDAVPLVLVHSLGLDHRVWHSVQRLLEPERRTISYDVLGHGAAETGTTLTSVEAAAHELLGLLDVLGIDTADVAGLSMGGFIAQSFAAIAPHRLRTLTLLSCLRRGSPAMGQWAALGREKGVVAAIGPVLERWFGPELAATDHAAVRYVRDVLHGTSLERWCAAWTALAAADVSTALDGFPGSVHLLAGAHDGAASPAAMEDAFGRAVREIPDGPHLSALTHPEIIADVLRQP